MNLNAGNPEAPLIYACGRFQSITPITISAVTADGQPYVAGTWAKRPVSVNFSCSGIVAPYVLSGTSFGEAVNQTASSGGVCLDRFNKPASPITFGPINVDPNPPTVTFANNAGTYTLDQPVSITCSATDSISGMASNTCKTVAGQAYTFGLGKHDISATGTDKTGNVGTATTSFTVQATPASLKAITVQLLNATNPVQVRTLSSYLDAAAANPAQFAKQVLNYQNFLAYEATGSLSAVRPQVKLLSDLAYGLTAPISVNDSDTRLQYSGSGWDYFPNRSIGNLNDDVHATTNNGDSVSFTFSGTGVAYVTERSDGYGLVDVYLDNAFIQTVDANAAGVRNQVGQILFEKSGLSAGQHTIKLVKKSGAYMLIDALRVQS